MSTPAEILRRHVPDIDRYDDTPKKYGFAFLSDEFIRKQFFKHIAKDGIELTPAQQARVRVNERIISSPDLGEIEQLLHLRRDNKMDAQLQKALDIPEVRAAVRQALGKRVALAPAPETPDYAALLTQAPPVDRSRETAGLPMAGAASSRAR